MKSLSSLLGILLVALSFVACGSTPRYEVKWQSGNLSQSDVDLIENKCTLFAEDKKSLWLSQNPLEKSTNQDVGFRTLTNALASSNRRDKAKEIYRKNLAVCLQESGLSPVKVCVRNCT